MASRKKSTAELPSLTSGLCLQQTPNLKLTWARYFDEQLLQQQTAPVSKEGFSLDPIFPRFVGESAAAPTYTSHSKLMAFSLSSAIVSKAKRILLNSFQCHEPKAEQPFYLRAFKAAISCFESIIKGQVSFRFFQVRFRCFPAFFQGFCWVP